MVLLGIVCDELRRTYLYCTVIPRGTSMLKLKVWRHLMAKVRPTAVLHASPVRIIRHGRHLCSTRHIPVAWRSQMASNEDDLPKAGEFPEMHNVPPSLHDVSASISATFAALLFCAHSAA